MNETFEFVDGTKRDRATRRIARSHAMKGKNVGKTHHRRSKLGSCPPLENNQTGPPQIHGEAEEDCITSIDGSPSMKYKALGTQIFSVSFPLETSPQGQQVIQKCKYLEGWETRENTYIPYIVFSFITDAMFPPRICLSLDHVQAYMLQSLFMDKTCKAPHLSYSNPLD